MTAPYFIEILTENGEVQQRQRIATLPIRIGRGYDNDFILDDAHTAAKHAIVEEDGAGGLLLRDLGSQNGVIHRGQRQLQVALSGNSIVRLGHTRLRVRASDHPVAPELSDTTRHDWEGLRPAVAVVLDDGVAGGRMRVVEDEVVVVAAAYADRQGVDALAPLHFAILGEDFNVVRRLHGLRPLLVEGARDSASRKVRVTRMPLA